MSTRSALMGCCAVLALALPAQAQTVVIDPVATTTEVVVTEPAPIPVTDTATTTDVVVTETTTTPAADGTTTTETTTVDTASGTVTTTTTVEPPANAGAFDALSPGQQKIARSLFDAQRVAVVATPEATGTATVGWTLDDIAAARQGTGWGNVFKQMQADGVVQAKSLGQVVSGKAATPAPSAVAVTTGEATATTYRHTRQTPVTVSYGNGGTTTMVTTKGGHARSPIMTADGGATTGATIKGGAKAGSQGSHAAGSGHAASVAATTASAAGAVMAHGGGKANGQGGGKGHSK